MGFGMGSARVFWIIGLAATAAFVIISLLAKEGSTYRVSFIFLSLLLWMAFYVRRPLALHPFHFALFASALLLHDLGAFGLYRSKFAGLEFDFYVHTWFGLVMGVVLRRALHHHFQFASWRLWGAVLIVVLGLGAIHELMEYSTNLFLGPEKGMLKPDVAGPFDTQEDLAHNAFGALIGLALYALISARRSRRSSAQEPDLMD